MKHLQSAVAALFVAPLLVAPVHAQIAAPNDAGVAFGHVHLHVADLDLHGRLLTELFDAKLKERAGFIADLFGTTSAERLADGSVTSVPGSGLIFTPSEEARVPTEGTVIDHVGFEVESMETFAEELRAKGVEFVFGPTHIESLDIWVAFFTDPSGVLVEVTEGLDNY